MTRTPPTGQSFFARGLSQMPRPLAVAASTGLILGYGLLAGTTPATATSGTEAACTDENTINSTNVSATDNQAIQDALDDSLPLICLKGVFVITSTLEVPLSVDDVHLYGIGSTSLMGGPDLSTPILEVPLSATTLTVENLGFTDGNNGAIRGNSVTVVDSTFVDNQSDEYGGAVSAMGNLTVFDSVFVQNSAPAGGAVFGYNVIIENSTFALNKSTGEGEGGGAVLGIFSVGVTNSTFVENSAIHEGGGIAAPAGYVRFSTFVNNTAATPVDGVDTPGAAIYKTGNETFDLGANIFASDVSSFPQLGIGAPTVATAFSNLGGNVFSTSVEEDLVVAESSSFNNSVTSLFGANWEAATEVPNSRGTYSVPLVAGSPALDAVPAGIEGLKDVLTDQRGAVRSFPADAGAYELETLAATGNPQTGALALGAAMMLATTGAAFIALRSRVRRQA